jgi:hypothetical protein
MGWRDFQFNKTTLRDKVYKEDKETPKQVTLSSSSSLSIPESPANQQDELEKTDHSKTFLRGLDKEGKVKPLNLADFQARAVNSSTLDELYLVLGDFNKQSWTLLERRDMNSSYTPVARSLAESAGVDMYRTLEDLAVLCWRKGEV